MTDRAASPFSYETLIGFIVDMDNAQKAIVKDKNALGLFVDYMVKGEDEISRFVNVKTQVESYLDNYDFRKGFQFGGMNDKVDLLLSLRSKLAIMSDEAKKLAAHPDRYGSRKAIDTCRDFTLTCKNKLGLDETKKALALVDANTQKLIEIRKQFESDALILHRINEVIGNNVTWLGRFKAYYAELRQYVDAFPHSGQDDMAVVNQRIDTAKQLFELLEKTQKTVAQINGCANRHNKAEVEKQYQTIVNGMASKMLYADSDKYKRGLFDVTKKVQAVLADFETERKGLQAVFDALSKRTPSLWKEDNEKMIEKTGGWLKSDTKRQNFDLSQLRKIVADLQQKKTDDVAVSVRQNPWLERRKHSSFHDGLVNSYITKSDYLFQVDEARKKRLRKILKWTGIGVGITAGIILLIYSSIARIIAGAILVIAVIIILKNH